MSRLILSFNCLIIFFSTMANGNKYDITFDLPPSMASRVVKQGSYCMRSAPNVLGLNNGKGLLPLETDGLFYHSCGYVHSSADYIVYDNLHQNNMEFELYKPAGVEAYIDIKSVNPRWDCQQIHDYIIDCQLKH